MKCIAERTVHRVWGTIATMPCETRRAAIANLQREQPHLRGFVDSFWEHLDHRSELLSNTLLLAVVQMFTETNGGEIPVIGTERILRQHEATKNLLHSVHVSGEAPSEELATLESANQPCVYRFVTTQLLSDEETDDYLAREAQHGAMFMILKTVIDAVDAATN